MSQENVGLGPTRARVPLPSSIPWEGTAADIRQWVAERWDENGDYYPVRKFPETRPCHGRDEITDFFLEFRRAWARWETTSERVIPIGDDRILVHTHVRAAGRESGLSLDGDLYFALWLRHRRYVRQEDHLTLSGALRALGLRGDTLQAAGLRGVGGELAEAPRKPV